MYKNIKNLLIIFLFFMGTTTAFSIVSVKLLKIYDGDTVLLKINENSFSARLYGIDCFETSKINRAYKQAYENKIDVNEVIKNGKSSKKYLEKLYRQNKKNIYFEFIGIDKYSRALGILYFNNININQDLVKNGGCYNYKF